MWRSAFYEIIGLEASKLNHNVITAKRQLEMHILRYKINQKARYVTRIILIKNSLPLCILFAPWWDNPNIGTKYLKRFLHMTTKYLVALQGESWIFSLWTLRKGKQLMQSVNRTIVIVALLLSSSMSPFPVWNAAFPL